MLDAYIGLGANSPDALARLAAAVRCLARLPHARVLAVSRWYRTSPQGVLDQPWFVNGVVRLACAGCWSAPGLVRALLRIEARLGRRRSPNPAHRYGPRAIDLDLLCFGAQHHSSLACTVPHPAMLQRAFVCIPLREVAPQGILPDGTNVNTALARLRYTLRGDSIYQ